MFRTVAQDTPLQREDRELPSDQLDEKGRQWQKLNNQATRHDVGQVPLAVGIPMQLTAIVVPSPRCGSGARGRAGARDPHPKKERLDVDDEWLLTRMPQIIYMLFKDARWTVHPELGKEAYPRMPVMSKRPVNKSTEVFAKRTGFLLMPYSASTSHVISGRSLCDTFVDLVTGDETDDTQVSGYVMLSRVRDIMNAYARFASTSHVIPGQSRSHRIPRYTGRTENYHPTN